MPIRTPRVTIITRRNGARVALSAGVPVELSAAEIAHLERDSPEALMPLRPADQPDGEGQSDGNTETETEEERLAREAVERAKAAASTGKGKGKGKGGKPAGGDAEGL